MAKKNKKRKSRKGVSGNKKVNSENILKKDVQKHITAVLLLLFALIAGVWGVYDWRNMFHTLHWWIFQNDSWKLPNRCYSLQLYPYPVWKKSIMLIFVFCFGFYMLLLSLAILIEWKRKR